MSYKNNGDDILEPIYSENFILDISHVIFFPNLRKRQSLLLLKRCDLQQYFGNYKIRTWLQGSYKGAIPSVVKWGIFFLHSKL
jgi:hypothetical protein